MLLFFYSYKSGINQTSVIGKTTELPKLNVGPQLMVLVDTPINLFSKNTMFLFVGNPIL